MISCCVTGLELNLGLHAAVAVRVLGIEQRTLPLPIFIQQKRSYWKDEGGAQRISGYLEKQVWEQTRTKEHLLLGDLEQIIQSSWATVSCSENFLG